MMTCPRMSVKTSSNYHYQNSYQQIGMGSIGIGRFLVNEGEAEGGENQLAQTTKSPLKLP